MLLLVSTKNWFKVLYSQPITFVRLDSEHVKSNGKSAFSSPKPPFLLVTWSAKLINNIFRQVALGTRLGLLVLDLPRGHNPWCWTKERAENVLTRGHPQDNWLTIRLKAWVTQNLVTSILCKNLSWRHHLLSVKLNIRHCSVPVGQKNFPKIQPNSRWQVPHLSVKHIQLFYQAWDLVVPCDFSS